MTAVADESTTTGLPPGPRLPVSLQTVLFGKHRARWVPRLRERYGDVFTVRMAPHRRTLVLVARAELIKQVFSTPNDVLHAGEGNAILGPIMGPHSVLLLDEGDHLRVRKQLMPAFHGHPMRGYREMIEKLSRDEVDSWPTGGPFRTHDRTTALTLEIILQVVFGVTDERRLAELRPVVERVVAANVLIMLGWSYPPLQRIPPWRQYRGIQLEFDRLLYAEIADRRRVSDLAERPDVLSRLLSVPGDDGLTDAEIRDNLITLLLAGHETTATALAWTFGELARRPDVQRRAQRAADDGDEVYLEAVVKESLRMHPVIAEVARTVKTPYEIGGFTLPVGTVVMPAIQLAQHDANYFDAPDQFDPQRFVDGQPAPNTWIPFGGGIRRCLGAGFSLMESSVVLGDVLRRFDLAPVGPPEAAKARNITLTPGRGGTVRLTRR
jgi:cytochrome P450